MYFSFRSRRAGASALAIIALACTTNPARAAAAPAVVDDFTNSEYSNQGAQRSLVDDRSIGGQSTAKLGCANGVLTVEGELSPGRGSPGFVSLPLPLAPDFSPQDASAYSGVRIRLKVGKGSVSVQVATTEVDNYDFHIGAPLGRSGDEFREVRIPFTDMKRSWSAQTPLNLKTITSVNLVAAGMAKGEFAYEVDEIGFY